MLRRVPWTVEGCTFYTDFRTLPLASVDVVIGMDWLESHSPMLVDWRHKLLMVPYEGSFRLLQGDVPTGQHRVLLHIEPITESASSSSTVHLELAVQEILDQFQDLFQAPMALTPSRACDHEIPLIEGAQPIFIRPYRYLPKLKDEIERQVQEMLSQGLIRHSSSSSPRLYSLSRRRTGPSASVWTFASLMPSLKSPSFPFLSSIS